MACLVRAVVTVSSSSCSRRDPPLSYFEQTIHSTDANGRTGCILRQHLLSYPLLVKLTLNRLSRIHKYSQNLNTSVASANTCSTSDPADACWNLTVPISGDAFPTKLLEVAEERVLADNMLFRRSGFQGRRRSSDEEGFEEGEGIQIQHIVF
ncbi:hypothetical protein L6452_08889 [Arctium lappa]|uniref:Uncharacterized protein n=1 Tax=Arctium lappa TaxID=4217 RepID=A0ACB9DJ50_ARCLA|nr:hypothetical protein L6452_08889 [Arctium lappa]